MEDKKLHTAIAAVALFLMISTVALLSQKGSFSHTLATAFLPGIKSASSSAVDQKKKEAPADTLQRLEPLPPKLLGTETVWLARCIYSETKQPKEQELVAWVVRNRVETNYRGNDSYREAVLDPYQFSAFNPGSRKRGYYSSLDKTSRDPGWQRALRIAYRVKNQSGAERPFSIETRHFFSERSMSGGQHPNWAETHKKVTPERYDIDERRFRFYKDIS